MAPFLTGLFRTQLPPAAPHHHTAAPGNCCSTKVHKVALPPTSSPSLASVFQLMDQNGDGLLSTQDMIECFYKLGVELSPNILNAFLSSFPLSHPGFLLFQEFEVLYSSVCKDLVSAYSPRNYPQCHVEPHASCPPHNEDDDDHSSISSDLDGTEGASSCGSDCVSVRSCDKDCVYHGHGAKSPSCVMESYGPSLPHEEPHTDGDSNDPQVDASVCKDDTDSDDDLLAAFRVFDKNDDGVISLPELQTVMCNLGFLQCREDSFCQGIMQRVDSNGDGVVDFSEFKHMMLSSLCG